MWRNTAILAVLACGRPDRSGSAVKLTAGRPQRSESTANFGEGALLSKLRLGKAVTSHTQSRGFATPVPDGLDEFALLLFPEQKRLPVAGQP